MQAAADPDALLGVVAQSSAALFALVGGLLASRYVSLHAEQQAAGRRAADLRRRLAEAEAEAAEAERQVDEYLVNEVLEDEDVYEVFVEHGFTPTPKQVLEAADNAGEGLNEAVLARRVAELGAEMLRARDTLSPLVPVDEDQLDWAAFRRSNKIQMETPDAWEWLYDIISRARADEAREGRQSQERAASKAFGGFGAITLQQFEVPIMPPIRGMQGPNERSYRERLLDRRDATAAAVPALRAELRLAEENYQASRQPEGFALALRALTFLAVVGIGAPVVVMGFTPDELHWAGRAAVIGIFFVGVVVLLRYLFVYAHYLDEEHKQKDLPRGLLGLFRFSRRQRKY